MVSKASEDLPEPDSPVRTTRLSRGMSTSTFLRLCSRAPRTRMSCMDSWDRRIEKGLYRLPQRESDSEKYPQRAGVYCSLRRLRGAVTPAPMFVLWSLSSSDRTEHNGMRRGTRWR